MSAGLLGLIVNARAREVRRRYSGRNAFWRSLLPEPLVRVTGSIGELEAAVRDFARIGLPAVAVLGGDGSQHHLIDALLRGPDRQNFPMVLALAGGTMNGVPRALGTGGPPERTLAAAMASLARGAAPVREHHPLQIREAASGTIRYGFSFATGLVFRAMQEYYRRPNPGMPDALRASALPLWAVLTGRPFYANIQLDLATPDGPWMSESPHTILASVFENPLLWFRPFAGQLGPPPAFHLAATSMRPREIATRMWSTFQGRCRHPRLRTGSCLKATVRGNVGYVIDGDLYSVDGRVDVVITPGPPVRFLAPS